MSSSAAASLRSVNLRDRTDGEVESHLAEESGLVTISNVDIPSEVRPGVNIPVSVTVQNDAIFIGSFDPDSCPPPPGELVSGYRLDLEVAVNGVVTESVTLCVPRGGQRTFTAEIRAPATNVTLDMDLDIIGHNSGNFQDGRSRTVRVVEDAQTQPCPVGFERDPDTGECVPIDGGNGDGGGGDSTADTLRAGALLLGVTAVVFLLGNLSD